MASVSMKSAVCNIASQARSVWSIFLSLFIFYVMAAVGIMGAGLSDSAGKHYYSFWLSAYFSATTALTIGFGDFAPIRWEGRLISVSLGLAGTVFVGVVVACVINGLNNAAE